MKQQLKTRIKRAIQDYKRGVLTKEQCKEACLTICQGQHKDAASWAVYIRQEISKVTQLDLMLY